MSVQKGPSVLIDEIRDLRRELDVTQKQLRLALMVIRTARHLAEFAFPLSWRSTWVKCSSRRYRILQQSLKEFDRYQKKSGIDLQGRGSRPESPAEQHLRRVTEERDAAPALSQSTSASLKRERIEVLPPESVGGDGQAGSECDLELNILADEDTSVHSKPFISIYPSRTSQFNLSKAAVQLAGLQNGTRLRFAFDEDEETPHFFMAHCEEGEVNVKKHGYSHHFSCAKLYQHLGLGELEETARFTLDKKPVNNGGTTFYKATLVQ